MPRRIRLRYDETPLTARVALDLLLQATRALGDGRLDNVKSALEVCREALAKHVRFRLRSKRAR